MRHEEFGSATNLSWLSQFRAESSGQNWETSPTQTHPIQTPAASYSSTDQAERDQTKHEAALTQLQRQNDDIRELRSSRGIEFALAVTTQRRRSGTCSEADRAAGFQHRSDCASARFAIVGGRGTSRRLRVFVGANAVGRSGRSASGIPNPSLPRSATACVWRGAAD